MQRNGKPFGIVIVFALAAGLGAALAFLKPAPRNGAVVPSPAPASHPVQDGSKSDASSVLTPASQPAAAPIVKPIPPSMHDKGRFAGIDMPAFVERDNGVYEAATRHYTALLSAADGLRYMPKNPDGTLNELRVKLMSVRRGAVALFDRASDDSAETELPVVRAGGLSFWRTPAFDECYEPRGDGVEQSFVLDSAPSGEGDLEFVCGVQLTGLTPVAARAGRHGGILFANNSGQIGARYGQVMVRDAAGKAAVIEPLYDAAAQSIHFAISKEWVESAKYPVVVDPLVGSDFAISNAAINTNDSVDQPTVCAGTTNYLVAWTDYTGGGPSFPQILGAVVTQAGVVSTPFAISNTVGLPIPWRFQRIECAYDGANWLVVWSDERQAGVGIYGAIVGSTGTLLGGTDFLIAATTGNVTEDPLVTYNGANYVVAWTDTPPLLTAGSQVFFTFVNSLGVSAQKQIVQSNFAAPFQSLEYLTAQRPNGDTLLLYQELQETPLTHRSTRIQTSGVVLDPGGTALFREAQAQTDGTTGFGVPIGAVFNNNEWQILSSYDQTVNSNTFLHHLSLDGAVTPPSGVFATMGVGPIGVAELDSFAPAFPGANEWLFLRNDRVGNNVYHILGKRVTFTGTDLDPIPFQVDIATQGRLRNAVASQSGNLFLAAWLDGRNSNTQPGGDAVLIAANLIDATAAGSVGTPLVAVANASPITGEAGVSVSFDSLQSTGTYTAIAWDFGDGTTSTLVSPTHVYKTNGTYIAELALTNAAYTVFDTVVISVGTGLGPATPIGTPLDNTPPIVPGVLISSVVVKLDFVNLNDDKATITGQFDVTSFNNALTGLTAQVALGSKSFGPFALDAKGTFVSAAGAAPAIAFAMSPASGIFTCQLANADLREEMSNLGMTNATITTNIEVPLPITVGVGSPGSTTLSSQASVGTEYHAVLNKTGTANYGFQGVGDEISGAFLITSFAAQEIQAKEHTFTIKGRLVKPGKFLPNTSGNFNVYLGDYHFAMPGGQVLNKGSMMNYTAKTTSGVKKFTLNPSTGAFTLQMLNIPQNASIIPSGTGLPLAKSGTDITKVNLNLSFLFDLSDGTQLSAGRFVNIGRTTSSAKSWKLR